MNKIKGITVLIVTYNSANYIESAVRSILGQTFRDFELLIIDDGSDDKTEDIVSAIKDSRIVYEKKEHMGFSKASNYGLKKASFDWVAKMDSDDISHPKRLETQLDRNFLTDNLIVCSWAAFFVKERITFFVDTPVDPLLLKMKFALHSYINNPSVLFNKNFILNNGGYCEDLNRFEDYELWLRLLDKSIFVVVPEYLLYMRIREDSLSNWNKIRTRNIIYDLQEKYYCDLKLNFGISSSSEQLKVKGWREYFYGNKNMARSNWNKIKLSERGLRMHMAYMLSFLSEENLNWFREGKFRLKLNCKIKRLYDKKLKLSIEEFSKILKN